MGIWNPFRYNAYLAARYLKISKEILTITKKNSSRKTIGIVDFGCGDGVQLEVICRSNKTLDFELSGVDLSTEALAVAKRHHPEGTFYEASVYDTPFPKNSFDLTISCDVIEHVQDANKMIAEMIRVTKIGAYIIIGTPLKYTEQPLDSMHVKEYFFEEFSALFSARPDVQIVRHTCSHPLAKTIIYSSTTRCFGLNIPIIRYIMNILTLITGQSPFLADNDKRDKASLMTYQFIVLRKQ